MGLRKERGKKPYTAGELFRLIDDRLRKEGKLPGILDYGLACSEKDDMPVTNFEWDTIGIVNFGGNEGIYLDIYLRGDTGNYETVTVNGQPVTRPVRQIRAGTYKTLGTSLEDFKAMGDLNAEFVFALRGFVEENMEDFIRSGFTDNATGEEILAKTVAEAIAALQDL